MRGIKKTIFVLLISFFLLPLSSGLSPSYAEYLLDVVETDEESTEDSLNRIAGEIDSGFSKPYQSYRSESHKASGPIDRSTRAYDNK